MSGLMRDDGIEVDYVQRPGRTPEERIVVVDLHQSRIEPPVTIHVGWNVVRFSRRALVVDEPERERYTDDPCTTARLNSFEECGWQPAGLNHVRYLRIIRIDPLSQYHLIQLVRIDPCRHRYALKWSI